MVGLAIVKVMVKVCSERRLLLLTRHRSKKSQRNQMGRRRGSWNVWGPKSQFLIRVAGGFLFVALHLIICDIVNCKSNSKWKLWIWYIWWPCWNLPLSISLHQKSIKYNINSTTLFCSFQIGLELSEACAKLNFASFRTENSTPISKGSR